MDSDTSTGDFQDGKRQRQRRRKSGDSYVIIPREAISQLEHEADLLALYTWLLSKGRYKPGSKTPKGQVLEPGQTVTGKRHIATLFGWTESKAYRAMKRLASRNLIEIKANRNGCIVSLVGWPFYMASQSSQRTETEPKSKHDRTETDPRSNRNRTHTNKEEGIKNLPPAPSCERTFQQWWQEEEGAIGVVLRKRGVNAVSQCIAICKARGVTPDQVKAIIAEFDAAPGAWDAGALYKRIVGDLDGWPDPLPEYRREQDRKSQLEKHAATASQRKIDEEQAVEDARIATELEARFGAIVDQMSCDEQRQLIRRHAESEGSANFLCRMVKPGKPSPTVRDQLFDLLSREETECFS